MNEEAKIEDTHERDCDIGRKKTLQEIRSLNLPLSFLLPPLFLEACFIIAITTTLSQAVSQLITTLSSLELESQLLRN